MVEQCQFFGTYRHVMNYRDCFSCGRQAALLDDVEGIVCGRALKSHRRKSHEFPPSSRSDNHIPGPRPGTTMASVLSVSQDSRVYGMDRPPAIAARMLAPITGSARRSAERHRIAATAVSGHPRSCCRGGPPARRARCCRATAQRITVAKGTAVRTCLAAERAGIDATDRHQALANRPHDPEKFTREIGLQIGRLHS
jgi:hypothetical protein